jgi:DNA-directed RNA polymerase specialized sigma24 family protein
LVDSDEEGSVTTRGSLTEDPHAHPPDQKILLHEIVDSLVDETDKQIVHRMLDGESEKDIATALDLPRSTVTKRLKKLGKRFNA